MLKFAIIIKFSFIINLSNFKRLKFLIFDNDYNEIEIYKIFYDDEYD